jgi:hypothetical protein
MGPEGMGTKLVVGSQDLQLLDYVGSFFYLSAYKAICQQKVNVVFYFDSGHYLFLCNDIYISDIFLFPRRAYVSVTDNVMGNITQG